MAGLLKKIWTGLNLMGNRITGVADPVDPSDVVTLAYLGNFQAGQTWKGTAVAAATTNVDLAAPPASFDGIAVAVNDRVLLAKQTQGSQNGVYVYRGPGQALVRAVDMDTAGELIGAVVVVLRGTALDTDGQSLLWGDRAWLQRVEPITLGTTPLEWIPLPGRGIPYTNGVGLTLTGSTFSVTPGNGILVDGTGVRIDPNVVTRKYASNLGAMTAGTPYRIQHNLGDPDVVYSIRMVANGEFVDADVSAVDANNVDVTFSAAQASGAVRFAAKA